MQQRNRSILFFLCILLGIMIFAFVSCTKTYSTRQQISGVSAQFPAAVAYTVFATGFNQPVGIVHAGDGSNRLFVIEKNGRIKIISNKVVLPEPFLDISDKVSGGGEQGLLGLAFPPGFSTKKVFYIDYTDKTGIGNTVVAKYGLSSDNKANPNSASNILYITQPFSNHNGGQLLFGPDGFLYVGTGDGGSAGDPNNNAQDTTVMLGKILRLDVESQTPYAIPAGNPFNNEVWAYGLRNPWRFSFDRITGDLYIGDVGQDEREEINFVAANAAAGNFGWRIMEGSACYNSSTCDRTGLKLPVAEYQHTGGDCSVTGGFVYRGSEFPALQGVYLYADYCSGRIRVMTRKNGQFSSEILLDTPFQISSFGEDEAGNLYFADYAGGTIYKIVVP